MKGKIIWVRYEKKKSIIVHIYLRPRKKEKKNKAVFIL